MLAYPNNYRHESKFASENQLIETIIANMKNFVPLNSLYVAAKELVVGAGIVDLVLGVPILSSLVNRLNCRTVSVPTLLGQHLAVLSQLYLKRKLSVTSISRRTGLNSETTTAILSELIEMGLCSKPSPNTFIRTPIAIQYDTIIAIEGKLKNWKRALAQAKRNRLFATYSYVVLDEYHAKPALHNIDLFRSSQIGLAIAYADTKSIKIVYKPSHPKPISTVFYLRAAEQILQAMLDNKSIVTVSERLDDAIRSQSG